MTEPTRPSPPREPREEERPPVMLPDGRANVSLLEDQFPPRLKAPRLLAIATAVLGVVFFWQNLLPIQDSDVWGHLAYGRWMVEQGSLPTTEPLLALAQGVPWVDVAWLSKLSGYWVFDHFGAPGLQMIHAACVTLACALLVWLVYRKTGRLGWALGSLAAFLAIDYTQLIVQRPQDFGMAAYALVLCWGFRQRESRLVWVGLPLLFALWANFHGSFAVGLVTLAAFAAGRGLDVLRRTRSLKSTLRSGYVWRAVLLLQVCAAAALINPVGIKVYADVLTIATNPNLAVLFDWTPLTIRLGQGQVFFAAVLLLAFAFRLSPRRVTAAELLLLAGFGLGTLWSLRMIMWFGPVAGYCLAVHGAAAWRKHRHLPLLAAAPERRGLWTVATVGLCWIFFAYTPFGLQRLHGRPTGERAEAEFRKSVIARTPLDALAYLQEHGDELPGGQMYNSQEWGDFMLWTGPEKFRVFVHSHVHLIPEEVWKDYLQILELGGEWQDKLNRYQVNSVLVDTTNYMPLIRALRDDAAWKEVFADPQGLAVLFVRRRPI